MTLCSTWSRVKTALCTPSESEFMSTTLLFVRHGESEANGNGFFAGQLDIPLSQRGLQQAELTARYIKENYIVDTVYSSDLQRAACTALPIARECGKELIQTQQLREIFAGQWQGMCFDDLQIKHANTYGVWLRDIGNANPPDGESVADLAERIWNIVQKIAENAQGKTVVIVTHATPIRALLCRLKGLGLGEMKNVPWVSNASVTVVRYDGSWTLAQESLDAHLAQLKTQFPANV